MNLNIDTDLLSYESLWQIEGALRASGIDDLADELEAEAFNREPEDEGEAF